MLRITSKGELMPTIRDLVGAIRQREGVEAAVVLGRDGLLIDGQAVDHLDAENVAAHVPQIVSTADEFGAIASRGQLATAVLEHQGGLAVLSVLSAEAILLVLVQPSANLGQLLFELRRNREHIAALV
jgi:predicted regulator of Ras-like GTPase activity (Roadblock/LC7/MglB family)